MLMHKEGILYAANNTCGPTYTESPTTDWSGEGEPFFFNRTEKAIRANLLTVEVNLKDDYPSGDTWTPEGIIQNNASVMALTNIWIPLQAYDLGDDLVWEGSLAVTRLPPDGTAKTVAMGGYIPRSVEGKIVVGEPKFQFEK